MVRFALSRLLQVAVSSTLLAVLIAPLVGGSLWVDALAGLALGAVAWAPTTTILLRVLLAPRPPHPRLVDADGQPTNGDDAILVLRANAVDQSLTALPWLFVWTWLGWHFRVYGAPMVLLATGAVVWSVWALAHAWLRTEVHVARVESALRRVATAERRLRRALRFTRGATRKGLLLMSARMSGSAGRIDEALATLDQLGDPDDGAVLALRAQLCVGRDPAQALALAEAPQVDPIQRLTLRALAALHHDQAHEVRRAEKALMAAAESVGADHRSQVHLLLAAAFADTDPERARRHLEAGGWGDLDARLPDFARLWPAVGRALAPFAR